MKIPKYSACPARINGVCLQAGIIWAPGEARDTPLATTFRGLTATEQLALAPRSCRKGKDMIMTGTEVTQQPIDMGLTTVVMLDMRDTTRMIPGIQGMTDDTTPGIQGTGIIGMGARGIHMAAIPMPEIQGKLNFNCNDPCIN